MLHQAKAPEPWARPDLLPELAATVDNAAAMSRGIPVSPEVKASRQAQAAITKLRRLLPELAGWSAYHASNPTMLDQALPPDAEAARRQRHMQDAAAKLALHAALFDVHQPAPPGWLPLDPQDRSYWHFPAVGLWLGYRATIGNAHISRAGPAVRFVGLALTRAGYRHLTLSAIETALLRHPITANRQ